MLGRPNQEIKQAVGEFASLTAHKLNNMLTGAMGYLEILKAREVSEEDRESYLDEVSSALEKIAELGKLMNLLGGSGTAPKLKPENPNQIFVLNAVNWRDNNDTVIEFNHDPTIPPIMADFEQIDHVLDRLVENVLLHNNVDVKITFSTRKQTLNRFDAEALDLPLGTYVVMSVEDHGRGMTPEVLARAFEPGFTTEANHAEHMGVGLSIVDAIMTAHGGRIAIKSNPGMGVTVNLWFPQAIDKLASIENQHAQARKNMQPPAPTARKLETKVVLVLETDETARMTLISTLQGEDYCVLGGDTASLAEQLAMGWFGPPISLFIFDATVPLATNALVKRIHDRHPGMQILQTARLQPGDVACEEPILAKPFEPEALVAKVRGLIG